MSLVNGKRKQVRQPSKDRPETSEKHRNSIDDTAKVRLVRKPAIN